jgi:hypothetical protein
MDPLHPFLLLLPFLQWNQLFPWYQSDLYHLLFPFLLWFPWYLSNPFLPSVPFLLWIPLDLSYRLNRFLPLDLYNRLHRLCLLFLSFQWFLLIQWFQWNQSNLWYLFLL